MMKPGPACKDLTRIRATLYFCNGDICRRNGSDELIQRLRSSLKREGMDDDFHTVKTHCAGFCDAAPVIAVQPDNVWYGRLDPSTAFPVLREHFFGISPDRSKILHPMEGFQE